jgi:hypothetical protein
VNHLLRKRRLLGHVNGTSTNMLHCSTGDVNAWRTLTHKPVQKRQEKWQTICCPGGHVSVTAPHTLSCNTGGASGLVRIEQPSHAAQYHQGGTDGAASAAPVAAESGVRAAPPMPSRDSAAPLAWQALSSRHMQW